MSDVERFKEYLHSTNASFVLSTEGKSLRARRELAEREGTGEATSLRSQPLAAFGDMARVSTAKPKELVKRLAKLKKQHIEGKSKGAALVPAAATRSAAAVDDDDDGGGSGGDQTADGEQLESYAELLGTLKALVGDELPPDALHFAADEALSVLKDESIRDPERKRQLEQLLQLSSGGLSDTIFARLIVLGKVVRKRADDKKTGRAAADDEGSADQQTIITLGDLEDRSGSDSDSSASSGSDASDLDGLGDIGELEDEIDDDDDDDDSGNVRETQSSGGAQLPIDGRWIERSLRSLIDKAMTADIEARLGELVLQVLDIVDVTQQRQASDADVLQQLVHCLQRVGVPLNEAEVQRFASGCLAHRVKLFYGTKLALATGAQRAAIEKSMLADRQLAGVLSELTEAESAASDDGSGGELLDLDALAFSQGAMLMSNRECVLPKDSKRIRHRKYEEVVVPHPQRAASCSSSALQSIADLPQWAQAAFRGIASLNVVQSAIYSAAFESERNLLVCAPTGSGKTNIALLTVLRQIGACRRGDGSFDLDSFKVVYVAPMKALVQEVVGNFSRRLADYGFAVSELSGDQNLSAQQLERTHMIVTTPEKWDIVTRKAGERLYLERVRLIIYDEVHLLHSDRGAVLESLVVRTHRQIEQTQQHVRLVALSATLPGYRDVASFLRVDPKQGMFVFDNSHRPVPLTQTFVGLTEKNAFKRLQLMNALTYQKLMEHTAGQEKQVIVFVHSRKDTFKTAQAIRDLAAADGSTHHLIAEGGASHALLMAHVGSTHRHQQQRLEDDKQADAAERGPPVVRSSELQRLLPHGLGIHHAGLCRDDRAIVEKLFHDRHLKVLISTATLAWGVNLPAHTVIIKGTEIYSPKDGKWQEIGGLDVMQMIGRAGRPGYDDEGEGVIITRHNQLQYYLSLINHQLPIESQLIGRLPDLLNAEIVLGTIDCVRDAVHWLSYSYLYICMFRSPALYGLSAQQFRTDPQLQRHRASLVQSALVVLEKSNLVRYDRRTGRVFSTPHGRVASHYYLDHTSMATYCAHLKPDMSLIELLHAFSLSNEFKYMHVRLEEKTDLLKLLLHVPVPIAGGLDKPATKANALLQTYIARERLTGHAILADMVYITQSADRILRALFELALSSRWARLADRCLALAQCTEHRMWPTHCPLRQLCQRGVDIPLAVVQRLESKDIGWSDLYHLDAQQLGQLVNMSSYGETLHRHIRSVPRLGMTVHVQPITRSMLAVEVELQPEFVWQDAVHSAALPFWLWVEDGDGDQLLHYEYFVLKKRQALDDAAPAYYLSFTVPVFEPVSPNYFIKVVADRWLGSARSLPVYLYQLTFPQRHPPCTELDDAVPVGLQPVLAASPLLTGAARDSWPSTLNAVQTQAFRTVYHTDYSLLLCAPAGSGLGVVAALAILHALERHSASSSSPLVVELLYPDEAVTARRAQLAALLPAARIVSLCGRLDDDVRSLTGADVVLATPAHWDHVSRRWQQLPELQRLSLVVAHQLHLLGAPDLGHLLEICLTRMRCLAKRLDVAVRFVALGYPLADWRAAASWLGVGPDAVFNFRPHVRPLHVDFQVFEQTSFRARQLAMRRPGLAFVDRQLNRHHSSLYKSSVLVYTPSYAESLEAAREWYYYAQQQRRRQQPVEQTGVDPASPFGRSAVGQLLAAGVGVLHEGLEAGERALIERCFRDGGVQVLFCSRELCWQLGPDTAVGCANAVLVLGTQYYDAHERRHVDYAVSDLIQMIACAGRYELAGAALVLCHKGKEALYRKFVAEPLPIESVLQLNLANHLNNEIVARNVESKPDALSYLTLTYFYHRLPFNPNYYDISGAELSSQFLSERLSELVEDAVDELVQAGCVQQPADDDDMSLTPLNLGRIACHYNVDYAACALFNTAVTSTASMRDLINVLCQAPAFDTLPLRASETRLLRELVKHVPLLPGGGEQLDFRASAVKANVLLQTHLSRRHVPALLQADRRAVVEQAVHLLQPLVDVLSNRGWLRPALIAMELSQLLVQAMWNTDSELKQLPHFSADMIALAAAVQADTVGQFLELDEAERGRLLAPLSADQVAQVAAACNRYPAVDLADVSWRQGVVSLTVQKDVDDDDSGAHGPVIAPLFPKPKKESWWLAVGSMARNQIFALKRVTLLTAETQLTLRCDVPSDVADAKIYLVCDAYCGADIEESLVRQD